MTPRLSALELAALRRKGAQPTRAPGDVLAVFVAGNLMNPLNGTPWVWQKRARYAKAWKERVGAVVFEAVEGNRHIIYSQPFADRMRRLGPKHVTFLASTHNRMDGDGLQAAMKPIRDALVECRIISGDADKDGNTFTYDQRIDRTRRGVEIRVRAR